MEGVGLGGALGMLLAGLLELWQRHSIAWARLGPVEQNLRRASHGAAFVLVPLFAAFDFTGLRGFGNFFLWLAHDPASAWPGFLLAAAVGCGLLRCIVGTSRMMGFPGDALLASQALGMFIIGAGGTVLLASEAATRIAAQNLGTALLWLLLSGLALTWAVVGAVRFLLTLGIGGGNARRIIKRQIRRNQTILGRPPGWRPSGPGLFAAALVAAIGLGAVWFFLL